MENQTNLGHNRTGTQMSPIDSAAMQTLPQELMSSMPESTDLPTTQRGDAQLRQSYAMGSDPLGSVPVPATLTGVIKSGAQMMMGKRPQVLMDKLGERLAFERGGTRLYDTLLAKCGVEGDHGPLQSEDLANLYRFRNEEASHFALVAQVLRELGGDPTAQTPCADLVGVEAAGLVQAMNDPRTSCLQSLHVMLDAELIDNAGWELLIQLARAAGHENIAERFQHAMQQEAHHLATLRDLVARLTLEDAGAESRMM
jgi:rubrerythrin